MIQFESMGPTGNIYWILGAARKELHKQRRITEYNTMWERVVTSQSYIDALVVIREYVELIDLDGKF
jgi:hypothetical protein